MMTEIIKMHVIQSNLPLIATTCIKSTPGYKDHIFVSLQNGFSLKPVQKEPVHKNHLSIKTTFPVFLEQS